MAVSQNPWVADTPKVVAKAEGRLDRRCAESLSDALNERSMMLII